MGADIQTTDDLKKPKACFGVRHVQSLMLFLGLTLLFSERVSMSLAVIAMTDSDNENSFDWSIQMQSVILSSFSWGYIILLGASGELAGKFGGMTLMILTVGINSIISLLLPTAAAYGGWIAICVCRGLQGLMQGTVFPSVHYLIGKWIPMDERCRLISIIYSGTQFGTAVQLIISGFLAEYLGWASIFYVNGVVGFIWVCIYLTIGSDNPQVSKRISNEERLYIQGSLGQIGGHKKLKTPWIAILTSLPFLAGVVANIGSSWGHWTLLTEIPTYMNEFLRLNIKSNGVMSALPYLTMFVLTTPVGFAADFAVNKNWVSVIASRKICNSVAFFGPAIVLVFLSYIPPGNVTAAVVLLCLIIGLNAGLYNGYGLTYLDMAPNFSGQLMALSNFTAEVVALFAPLTAGFILSSETNSEQWRTIFLISAAVYIFTNIIFVIFGTSQRQKWNEESELPIPRNKINIEAYGNVFILSYHYS